MNLKDLAKAGTHQHISDNDGTGKLSKRSQFIKALPDKEKALKIAEEADSYEDGMELHDNVVQIWYEFTSQVRNSIKRATDKGIKAESAGDMSVKFYL